MVFKHIGYLFYLLQLLSSTTIPFSTVKSSVLTTLNPAGTTTLFPFLSCNSMLLFLLNTAPVLSIVNSSDVYLFNSFS